MKRLRGNPVTVVALAGLTLLILVALLAPWIAPFDPLSPDAGPALSSPDATHWAGTDQIGRDIFSRLIWGARYDLTIAFSAVAVSALVGAIVGAFSGYAGGWADRALMRVVDVLTAFPLFVLAMALIAALGPGIWNVIIATAVINLPFYIRFSRAGVAARRGMGWIEAARLSGHSHGGTVMRFLLPALLPMLSVQISVNLGWAVLNAAGLSFLGLGLQPPAPEWGVMVAEGAGYVTSGRWWPMVFPGAALSLTVLCFNLAGDGLRDLLDPRRGA